MIWKLAWKIHTFLLPYLHYFDIAKAKDTYANLAVIWYDFDDDTYSLYDVGHDHDRDHDNNDILMIIVIFFSTLVFINLTLCYNINY